MLARSSCDLRNHCIMANDQLCGVFLVLYVPLTTNWRFYNHIHVFATGGEMNKKLSYCWETVRRESMPRIAEVDVEMTT